MKRLERLTNIVRNEVKEAMRDALMQEKTRVLRLVNVTADIQVDIDIWAKMQRCASITEITSIVIIPTLKSES